MNQRTFVTAVLVLAFGQTAHSAGIHSPYAGQELREIKALSSEDVQSLLAGKGMGLAKAAELNGYPGPSHVLQLASELQLSERQRAETQALFNAMEAKAVAIGTSLVEAERELDQLFAMHSVTSSLLASKLERIGQLQAQVRGVHLDVHLAQYQILTPEQRALYAKLRGYSSAQTDSGHRQHHMH